MRSFFKYVIGIAGLSSFTSCAGIESNLCDGNPEDGRCIIQPIINGSLTTPQRLHYRFNGPIKIQNVSKNYHAKLIFKDGSELKLADIVSGQTTLNLNLSSNDQVGLSNLKFSPLDGGSEEIYSFRLYAKTNLQPTNKPFSPSVSPNHDGSPAKIGIGTISGIQTPNVLISLNQLNNSTIAKIYQYDATQQKLIYPTGLQIFDTQLNLISIAVTRNSLINYYFQSNAGAYPAFSSYCPINANPVCTAGVMLSREQSLKGPFLADRRLNSNVYAISKDGKIIDIYELDSGDVSNVMVPFPNNQWASDISGMLATFGDLDGDQKGELIAWQQTALAEKILVFRRTASGFQYDRPYSQALQASLGSTDIKALAAGDLDGDGLDEVVVSRVNVLYVVPNQTVLSDMPAFGALTSLPAPISKFTKIDQISVGSLRPAVSRPIDSCNDIAIATTDGSGWLEAYINSPI